jgi:hypothetical protein
MKCDENEGLELLKKHRADGSILMASENGAIDCWNNLTIILCANAVI